MIKNTSPLPFKISCLVFITNTKDELLLIKRAKAPNKGFWSPIGGKLDMNLGESPYECAQRETQEETMLIVGDEELHCFGYISEKNYEGTGHWLMFLFQVKKKINRLPEAINEGHFKFFSREQIDTLDIPKTDKTLLWPYYDSHRSGFIGIRANCNKVPSNKLEYYEELSIL